MKPDLEEELERRIREGNHARDVIRAMLREGKIQNEKQAYRTLEKWDKKGIWDYGVCLDLGWFEDEDLEARMRRCNG